MAGDRMKFFVDLVEKVSGPADTAGKSLGRLEVTLEKVEEAEKKVAKTSGWTKFTAGAKTAWKATKAVGETVLEVGKYLLAASAAAAGVAFYVGKTAIEAVEGKQALLHGLALFEGSEAAAGELLDKVSALADATGQDDDAIGKMVLSLRRLGLGADDAMQAVKAALDVKALGGDEASDALIKVLEKAKAGGDFDVADAQLAKIGLRQEWVVEQLALLDQFKGKTKTQILEAMKGGKVSAEAGSAAILAAIDANLNKGGGLGSTAEKILGGSVSGQLQTLKNAWGNLFEDLDLSPLIKLARILGDFLKGDAGKRLTSVISDAFGMLGKFVAGIDSKAFTGWSIALEKVARAVIEIFAALGGGFFGALAEMFSWVRDLLLMMDESPGTWAVFIKGIKTVGVIFGGLVAGLVIGTGAIIGLIGLLVGAVVDMAAWIVGKWDWVKANWRLVVAVLTGGMSLIVEGIVVGVTWIVDKLAWFAANFSQLATDAYNWGANIVTGLGSGLADAWNWLVGKLKGLVDMLPAAVKSVLGIASPSKVMKGLGVWTVQGFTEGILAGAPANENAMSTVAAGAASGAVTSAAALSGGAQARGGGIVINIAQLTINVGGGTSGSTAEADAQGRAAARAFVEELGDALEGLAVAVGA